MGFVSDFFGEGDLIDVALGGQGDVLDLGGRQGDKEAKEASLLAEEAQQDALGRSIAEIQRSTTEGQGFLAPFGGVGLQGVEQASFLTDPQAQFDFLQNNPLFQMGLDNANTQTNQFAAARGRLSSGDTLQQLNNNALLTASPLIQGQKNSIGDLLNFGSGIATNQANTAIGQGSQVSNAFQNQGNVTAGGIQGRNQISQDTRANQQQTAATIASMFSDPALKENIKRTGSKSGFNIYSWDWNILAGKLGLTGSSAGVMADQVKSIRPEAVTMDRGFMKVNYEMIGV